MSSIIAIIKKEFKNFSHSGRATIFLYALIASIWGVAIAETGDVYLLMFLAVMIVGSFTNTVFISERVNGALEILITSGFSRRAVLFGKMAYILLMAVIMLFVCMIFSTIMSVLMQMFFYDALIMNNALTSFSINFRIAEAVSLYIPVAFMCVASSAYFSVRLSTPRFLHFINIFITGIITGISIIIIETYVPDGSNNPTIYDNIGFIAAGIFFTILADKQFSGEHPTRPTTI